ncbi:la-related protein 1C-like [Pyrus x bretschneideri]|uniref:la-related protein 1C-like n=1 Tax=Pyrus x bretschneideri TaxID=225117 RepID=UPI00202EC8FA|nr:la-related protein 1C-like [Pyrus x bretschneideri]
MAAINAANKGTNTETAPSATVQSPRNVGKSVSSPTQSRRATRAVSSPWTQIVRGESELIAAVASSPSAAVTEPVVAAAAPPSLPSSSSANQTQSNSSSQSNSASPPPVEESVGESSENGNAGKRPAWNKPSNGAVEVGSVMGAVSWPALSESARASTKSSSESPKGVSEPSLLSVSQSQGTGTTPTSSPKQGNPSTPNHTGPPRQRSLKRNNSNASSNGGASQHQSSAGQGVELPSNNPSPKEHTPRNAFGSQSHSNNDHPQQRNSFRGRNGGSHPRGEGSHHNYRRDQDRGNQDWNTHRNFNNRDNHMHSPRGVPRMMRPHQTPPPPPPNAAQFIHQPQMRAFGGPIGFDMQPHQLVYVTHAPHEPLVPFVAPLRHPMMFPAPDPHLHTKIINQIDYYFSNDNLIKDTYLRRNMDDQGWVRIKLIVGFKKVMSLTDNIQLILDAMRMSTVVEVQGDKIRRRNDWERWVMPSAQPPNASGSQTPGRAGPDMLSAHIQSIALDENTTNNNVENNNQPQLSNGDGTGQFGVQAVADRPISARN